jgi:hypothetical protein
MAQNSMGKTVIKSLNLKFYGPEPIYDRLVTGKELTDALNWYNYNLIPKEAIAFLVSYLNDQGDKETAKIVKSAGEKYFSFTLGKIARMIQNGSTLPDYAYGWLKDGISEGIVKYNRSKIGLVSYKAPGKLNETNASMLHQIETIIENRSGEDVISILEDAKVTPKTANQVIEYLTEESKKTLTFFTAEEEDEKKEYIEAIDEVISDIMVFLNGGDVVNENEEKPVPVKKPRKPRAKKVITPEKKVAKVSYLKEFAELGLKSIDPKEIIGKTALWYYDVRYQKLVVVRKADGLDVKGTTVIFDEKTSESKKIGRKTKETLDLVLKGGKIALKKIFENIKTGNVEVTGRLSENTILLRVEK